MYTKKVIKGEKIANYILIDMNKGLKINRLNEHIICTLCKNSKDQQRKQDEIQIFQSGFTFLLISNSTLEQNEHGVKQSYFTNSFPIGSLKIP